MLAAMAFGQTGLLGGSDGLHQQNAQTLGQWRFAVGIGGNQSWDNWSVTRGGVYYADGVRKKMEAPKVSSVGNIYAAAGVHDYVDVGIAFNALNYDRSYSDGYWEAVGNMRPGDLQLWAKGRAPFIDSSSVLSLAMQLDMYLPTGTEHMGLRPRHAWFIRGRKDTQAFTANEVVLGATAIMTLDFSKMDVPLRWNTSIGFVYANHGANTLVYSTGIDWDITSWVTAFAEFSGEFRVENNGMPIDFSEDPMLLTPGLRFHLPCNIDLYGGLDISTRMMRVGYDRKEEFANADKFTIRTTDSKGKHLTYGYTPVPTYSLSGALTWTFGGAEKAPEYEEFPVAPVETPAPDTVVQRDTVKVNVTVLDTIPDSDGDGVPDSLDKCPNSSKDIAVDTTGCPRDFDGDGVPDYMDQCPNTVAGDAVDSTGCALDSDKDGVADNKDKCPATVAGTAVDTTGCPRDLDKDGLADGADKCPNNIRGVKVNKKGCPVKKNEDLDKLKKGITFKNKSASVKKGSYGKLKKVVSLMKKYGDANIEIQVHTDNSGDSTENEILSQDRAKFIADYFICKGVDASRVKAVGYGSRMPIADNKTKKGRNKNRRVEFVPFYSDEQH